MAEERTTVQARELSRWLILAGIIVVGVALYFWLAPRTEPVVHPVQAEPIQ